MDTINGRELRTIACGTFANDLVFFEDSTHHIHPIYTAVRMRIDGMPVCILQELGEEIRDGFPLNTMPQELIDKLKPQIEKHFE